MEKKHTILFGAIGIAVLAGIVFFFLAFYPEHPESEKSIKAYLASTLPVVDGIKSEGEWDDTVFYEFEWMSGTQNITDGALCLTIGFKFNQTHLFVLATINDNDFNSGDTLVLIFDSDDNVSGYQREHLDMFAENGSIGNGAGGFCVPEDGTIRFSRGIPRYREDQPVSCTYSNGTYTFEGAFKLDRLNLASSRLNIAYKDAKSGPGYEVSLVNLALPSEYRNSDFIESTSEGQKGDNELQFEIYLAPRLLGVLSNEFPPGEPIEIMGILANESTSNVNVLRTEVGTLAIDFEIVTPEGYVLHYAGPYWWHLPHVDTLAPGTCETSTIDITSPHYDFGNDNIEHYEFTTEGDYSIRGIYRSDPSLVGGKSVENCLLYSTVRNFTISDSEDQARILINEVFYSENFCAWFEVYNPTNRTIDTSGWLVWFYSINGPAYLPHMNILPGEYVVICPNEELVREQWDLPSDVRVFEMDFGARYDSISISAGGLTEEATGIDAVPDGAKFPALEPGHSWARYAGGHDTGNFANDFYDEPHPTPGRPNNEVKENLTMTLDKKVYYPSENLVVTLWNHSDASITLCHNLRYPFFYERTEDDDWELYLLGEYPRMCDKLPYIGPHDQKTVTWELENFYPGEYMIKIGGISYTVPSVLDVTAIFEVHPAKE